MWTRSQLRFVERIDSGGDDGDSTTERRIAPVYRHSDGNPESVLRDLSRLTNLLEETRGERGPSYAAAQLIFLEKLRTMELYLDRDSDRSIQATEPADLLDPTNMEHLDQPMFLLSHGVENPSDGIYGDEAYLYVVELPTRNTSDEPAEWTVKVSGHSAFPRWDGPTDEAFERATWQFRGSLKGAVTDLVTE